MYVCSRVARELYSCLTRVQMCEADNVRMGQNGESVSVVHKGRNIWIGQGSDWLLITLNSFAAEKSSCREALFR